MNARLDAAVLDLGDPPRLLAGSTLPTDIAPPVRQVALCPYCGNPLPGLLALCQGTAPDGRLCLSHDLDDDRAYSRSLDHD